MTKLMQKILVLGCFALFTAGMIFSAGCSTKSAALPDPQPSVDFFNSDTFDRQLSSGLKADLPEVNVMFPAAITLNSIPKRLDIWLTKIEEGEGKVQLIPLTDGDKGIFTEVLSMMTTAYEYADNKALYGPVEEYNAFIYYKKTTGIVEKIAFERKETAEPAK